MGVSVHTAVWDAGYRGRSEALLVVYNEAGFRIRKDARVIQLIFMRLESGQEGYKGRYLGENV
jgi:dUTP pyrophosphatase